MHLLFIKKWAKPKAYVKLRKILLLNHPDGFRETALLNG